MGVRTSFYELCSALLVSFQGGESSSLHLRRRGTGRGNDVPREPHPLSRHGNTMTDPTLCCPTCGALLQTEQQIIEDATAGSIRLWQCEHGHWWLQSPGFGWMAIDPGDIAADAATTTGEEE
jgi:hypothetical protein